MAAPVIYRPVYEASPLRNFLVVLLATAWAETQRKRAYTIEIVRWPLSPLIYFLMLLITYRTSGQATAGGYAIEGFLLVGAIGMVMWTSTLWTGGYAIEMERTEGTINSLFLTPGSRTAVIMGYTIGAFAIFVVPTVIVLAGLAYFSGAQLHIESLPAVLLSLLVLALGSLALGHVLAGAFVLTRRANMWANFLQAPIYLLSGMVVPISNLPEWLRWFSVIFPISAGVSALRESLLAGAGAGDISSEITRFALSSLVLFVIGSFLLRRVERVAKSGGQFDLD